MTPSSLFRPEFIGRKHFSEKIRRKVISARETVYLLMDGIVRPKHEGWFMSQDDFNEWWKRVVVTAVSLGIATAIYNHEENPHPIEESEVKCAIPFFWPTMVSSGVIPTEWNRWLD
jgi:hypothetical protein